MYSIFFRSSPTLFYRLPFLYSFPNARWARIFIFIYVYTIIMYCVGAQCDCSKMRHFFLKGPKVQNHWRTTTERCFHGNSFLPFFTLFATVEEKRQYIIIMLMLFGDFQWYYIIIVVKDIYFLNNNGSKIILFILSQDKDVYIALLLVTKRNFFKYIFFFYTKLINYDWL